MRARLWESYYRGHPFLALFFAALAFRMAAVVALNFLPFQGRVFAADSDFYVSIAGALTGGADLPRRNVNLSQWLFGGYLALVYTVSGTWNDPTGRGVFAVGVGNALLGSLAVILVARSAGLVFGPRAATAAGIVAAVTPYSLFWTPYVLREPPGAFLVALGAYAVLRYLSNPSPGRALQSLAASAWLTVYPYFVAVPMALSSLLFSIGVMLRAHPRARKGAALAAVVAFVIWLAVPSPGVLGQVRTRVLGLGVEQLYSNFGPGQVAATNGYWERNTVLEASEQVGLTRAQFGRELTLEQRTSIWANLFARHLITQPGQVFALVPAKLYNMWRPTWEAASARNAVILGGGYLITMTLAFIGMLVANRQDQRVLYLLIALGGFVVVHVYTYGMIRFREYPMQVLLIFSGLGATTVIDRVRRRRRQ